MININNNNNKIFIKFNINNYHFKTIIIQNKLNLTLKNKIFIKILIKIFLKINKIIFNEELSMLELFKINKMNINFKIKSKIHNKKILYWLVIIFIYSRGYNKLFVMAIYNI